MGFAHINMDLIVGLPGESYDDVEHTMKELEAMAPDSVTVHSLAIKRAARLSLFKDKYEEMGLENNMQIMDMTARYCAEMGLSPYYLYRQKNMAGNFENVGYAQPEKAGIYNILIMEEKTDHCGVRSQGLPPNVSGMNRIRMVLIGSNGARISKMWHCI